MTLDRQAARARCEAASPAPWVHFCAEYERGVDLPEDKNLRPNFLQIEPEPYEYDDLPLNWDNCQFIAYAREDLPAALDEIDRLERLLLEHGIMSPKEATHAVQEQRRCEGSVEALEGEQPRKGTGEQAAVANQECGGNRGAATGQAGGDA